MKKVTLLFSILIALTLSTNLGASDNEKEYECDSREYCSQMTSCEEAIFFSENCSEKMDGDGDGIPCERQWCTYEYEIDRNE